MVARIALTQGKVAIVDDGDYERVAALSWHANYDSARDRWEAAGRGPRPARESLRMHRFILGAPAGVLVDHINGDPLDNRRENLRLCTDGENKRNSKRRRDNTSGFKGVKLVRRAGCALAKPWVASIKRDNKTRHLGYFATPEEAARAYDRAAREHFGEFARLNFPEAT